MYFWPVSRLWLCSRARMPRSMRAFASSAVVEARERARDARGRLDDARR